MRNARSQLSLFLFILLFLTNNAIIGEDSNIHNRISEWDNKIYAETAVQDLQQPHKTVTAIVQSPGKIASVPALLQKKSTETSLPNHVNATEEFSFNAIANIRNNVKSFRRKSQSYFENVTSKATMKLKFSEGINDESFLILAKNTRNLEELDFSYSLVNDDQLREVLPALVKSNPTLKSINLENTYISSGTLKLILEAFPLLEELNIKYLNNNFQQQREILLPWIKNNPNLKLLKPYYVETAEQLEDLIAAIPEGLQGLELFVSPDPITAKIMTEVFPKLAQKCGHSMEYLKLWGVSVASSVSHYAIDAKNFNALPEQFPHLRNFHYDCDLSIPSSVIRDTYLKWHALKVLNFSDHYDLTAEDAAKIIQHFDDIVEVKFCDYSDVITSEGMQTIANALVTNHAQSLKSISLPGMSIFQKNGVDPALITLQPLFQQLESFQLNWFTINNDDMNYLGDHVGGPFMKELWVSILPSPLDPPPAMQGKVFVPAFKKIAQRSPAVHTLGLNGNLFAPMENNPLHLEEIASNFTDLRHLDLYGLGSFFGGELINPLLVFIKNNPDLEYIRTSLEPTEIKTLEKLSPEVGHTLFISGR